MALPCATNGVDMDRPFFSGETDEFVHCAFRRDAKRVLFELALAGPRLGAGRILLSGRRGQTCALFVFVYDVANGIAHTVSTVEIPQDRRSRFMKEKFVNGSPAFESPDHRQEFGFL